MKPELVGCTKIGGILVLLKYRSNERNIVPQGWELLRPFARS